MAERIDRARALLAAGAGGSDVGARAALGASLDESHRLLHRGRELAPLVPALVRLAAEGAHPTLEREATRALAQLERALDSAQGRDLARQLAVALLPAVHGARRSERALALSLLARGRWLVAVPALLSIARDASDPLRPDVLRSLPAFEDEAVDLFLVGALSRPFDKQRDPHPFNLVLERIRGGTPLGQRASDKLVARLAQLLLSTDWREASRATALSRGLASERAAPLLIDGLAAWERRERMGIGSRRVQGEISSELRRISGRTIGDDPDAWTTWWIAVRQGRVEIPARSAGSAVEAAASVEEGRTRSSFFGLRPVSDRVTFVIDHSGSMANGWGTEGHSRYVEAIDQMIHYLQAAGERTRFDVILFGEQPQRSSERMLAATPATLERLREDLLRRVPDGGTHLRPAILVALGVDPTGAIDYERLEADTIVVLCDGETAEGPAWVGPLLESLGAESRIRFHGVHLGIRDDGTLAALAEGTGGDFLRLGG